MNEQTQEKETLFKPSLLTRACQTSEIVIRQGPGVHTWWCQIKRKHPGQRPQATAVAECNRPRFQARPRQASPQDYGQVIPVDFSAPVRRFTVW